MRRARRERLHIQARRAAGSGGSSRADSAGGLAKVVERAAGSEGEGAGSRKVGTPVASGVNDLAGGCVVPGVQTRNAVTRREVGSCGELHAHGAGYACVEAAAGGSKALAETATLQWTCFALVCRGADRNIGGASRQFGSFYGVEVG